MIYLTADETRIATWLGKSRNESNRAAQVADARVGTGQTSLQIDILGACGEFAFCKLFNIWPDLTIGPRQTSWVGDTQLRVDDFNIVPVDVKTTGHRDGQLLATLNHTRSNSPLLFALMVANSGETGGFIFGGFALAYDLLHPSRIVDLGYGPTYAMNQNELMRSLIDVKMALRERRTSSSFIAIDGNGLAT